MTSKISFSSILKEDFRRRIWMAALSILASFITMPITFLLANRNYLNRAFRGNPGPVLQESYIEFFHSYGCVFQAIVLGIGALVVAVWGFRYLYSRRMVDLYHAIPVKREKLFLATYLNGLLIWLIPMLTATLITLLIALGHLSVYRSLSLALPVITAAWKLILVSIISFLSVYHFILVCVMLSGNVVNVLLQTAVYGCSAAACYLIIQSLFGTFFDTYCNSLFSMDLILWASPMIGPFYLIADFANSDAGILFLNLNRSSISAPLLFRMLTLVLTGLYFALARKLYLKRPSELAEHGVDSKPAQIILRFCAGALSALFGALIFLWLVDDQALAWQIFGLLFCGTLGLGVTEIIMQTNYKAFFQHKFQMALCLAGSLLVLCVFFFDLTGYDRRLPDKDRIQSATVTLSQYNDNSYDFTFEGDTLVSLTFDPEKVSMDIDKVYPLLEAVTAKDRTNRAGVGSVTVHLKTPFGSFQRRYRIQEEDKELVRSLVEDPHYLESFYPASLNLLPHPQELYVNSNLYYEQYKTTSREEIAALLEAYALDFRDNTSLETLNTGIIVGSLELPYDHVRYGTASQTYYFSLDLYSHYTRTLDKIREYYPDMVFTTEELTVTSIELYPAELFDAQLLDFDSINWKPGTEEIWHKYITIQDPDELDLFLPYVTAGNYQLGMFAPSQTYHYLGQAILNSGRSVSLLVEESDLPLPITPTIETTLKSMQD